MDSKGFTLLELLFAMSLGVLVVAALLTAYLSAKADSDLQQGWLDLQESGRFAVYILNQRIRLAGFVGCADHENPVNPEEAIQGYDSTHLPGYLQPQVTLGTDAVEIYSCISNTSVSKNTALKKIGYFIGDTHRKNSAGQPILALFQKPTDGDREELISGVEQMQLLYGVLSSDGANHVNYFPAAQVKDWKKVLSVQVDLLLNSVNPILPKPQSYYFRGQTVTPKDHLLHKPWSAYVTLRERVQ